MYESQVSGSAGHRHGGDTNIPEKELGALWKAVRRTIRRGRNPDLEMFEGCRLFWNFKGLKYYLSAENEEDLKGTMEGKVEVIG
jgi:hypothetical protein